MEKKRCLLILPLWEEDDLIQEILVRLPVVSLFRFKSVCKSWCALIESSFFIDLHTTTTLINYSSSSSSSINKFGSFILLASVDKHTSECALLMLSSSSESDQSAVYISGSESGSGNWWWSIKRPDDEEEEDYRDQPDYNDQVFKVDDQVFKLDCLGFPLCYQFYSSDFDYYCPIDIVGSCNGLVCLKRDRHEISLCNPTTRQFRILPNWIPSDDSHLRRNLVAFGFDVETKDYKVVLVSCLDCYRQAPVECRCRVQVYSLSTDSWRLLEGITCLPGAPLFDEMVLYLNGSCFFIAKFFHNNRKRPCVPENDRFIISFDLTKEIIITPMQLLPDHRQYQDLYLSCLGDKIVLFTRANYSTKDDDDTFEDDGIYSEFFNIWVLNHEHGSSSSSSSVNKKSCWTRLYSFRIESKISGQYTIPRGLSNDGEFALLETTDPSRVSKKMKLYNLATKQVKKNFLSCSAVMSKVDAYKPSLVSIIGGNGSSACTATAVADRVIGNGATNL